MRIYSPKLNARDFYNWFEEPGFQDCDVFRIHAICNLLFFSYCYSFSLLEKYLCKNIELFIDFLFAVFFLFFVFQITLGIIFLLNVDNILVNAAK
jgi:hypothetical protein